MTYSLARNSQVQTAKFDPRGGNRRGGKREGPSSQFSEGRTCRRGEILPQYFLSMNTDDVKKAYAKLPGRIIKGPPHRRKAPYSGDPKDFILDFGKHAGTALKDTPVSYLIWMVENITNKPDLIELVKRYLSNGGLTSMKGLRSKVVSIAGLSTKRSPLTPSPAKQAQGEKGGTSPAPVPARSAEEDVIEETERWIQTFYQRAEKIDPTRLKEETALKYRFAMDTCRRMQCIIDRDCGDHSQETQLALRALRALLAGP